MLLSPSILAADLANLAGAVRLCAQGGADLVHVDVMDGHFVPNLTIGIPVVRALAGESELPLEVHLMVSNPDGVVDDYLEAGADWLSVHWEAAVHPDRLLGRIHEAGAKAGIALNPATPVEVLADILPKLEFVLLMSVNPGFAGQTFLPYVLDKARRLRTMVAEGGAPVTIAMDGGLDLDNIGAAIDAGVELCVAGSAVFGSDDPAATLREMRRRAEGVRA